MKTRSILFTLLVLGALVIAACGAAAATSEPEFVEAPASGLDQSAQPVAKEGESESVAPQAGAEILPVATNAAYEIANASGDLTVVERANRMMSATMSM